MPGFATHAAMTGKAKPPKSPIGRALVPLAVVAATGVNIWLSLALAPGLPLGALSGARTAAATVLPLVLLAVGLIARSETILLLAFPATLLVPLALAGRLGAWRAASPAAFLLCAAGLVAYLFAASALTERATTSPERVRHQAAQPVAHRERTGSLAGALALLALLFPGLLLHAIHFTPTNRAFLSELYPGREDAVLVLLDLGVVLLSGYVASLHFLGLLFHQRRNHPAMFRDLETLRRGPRVSPLFFLAAAGALAAMGLIWVLRYR